MLTKAEEKCTSQSFSSAVTGSIGKNEATYASLELGYSNSKTSSVTRTEGIEKCRSYSSQHSETITVPMSGKKPGYYRYVLMGDIESYVAVIYNLENKTYTHTTYSVIISQGFVLDYSETLEFDDSNQQKIQFTFDENKIKNMIPTLEIGTKVDVSGLPAPLTYDSGYKEKKVDASHSYYYDTLDLYSLKSYFHPSYIFTFNIRVLMKEENAGFQEIYLTNGKDGKDSRVGGNGSIEYGGSGSAYETKGWTEISVTVRGDQCAETMYLEYGAHGDSSDDWYRYQAQVTITVTASEN